jgi:hypothetical protein
VRAEGNLVRVGRPGEKIKDGVAFVAVELINGHLFFPVRPVRPFRALSVA